MLINAVIVLINEVIVVYSVALVVLSVVGTSVPLRNGSRAATCG